MRLTAGFRVTATLLLFALALNLNLWLERVRRDPPLLHSLYFPSGKYLRFASLGYHDLLADGLYIWSIQYYSEIRQDRWRYLARLYDVITDLDPEFVAGYSTGALILALEAEDRPAALKLLDRGIARIPSTYALAWEAGFYARDMGDYKRASEYFRVASQRPDAMPIVEHWYRFTLDRAGNRLDALRMWQEAYQTARNPYERGVAERYIHDLRLDLVLDLVREAITQFRARERRNPVALEELVKMGDLGALPLDPDGEKLLYDRQTGEVKSSSSHLLKFRLKQ